MCESVILTFHGELTSRRCALTACVFWITSVLVSIPAKLNFVGLTKLRLGTRGATSAEYFLKAGYAVIFMHRQFSLQPFSRHYSHSTNPFLDFISVEDDTACITADKRSDADLLAVLTAYKSVQSAGNLHTITFVTVNDYLWLLRAVSQELSILRRRAMYYLAAAVSDFFLPRQKLVRLVFVTRCPVLICERSVVGAQDSVWQREPAHRDGPGAQNPEALGGRMDARRVHRVI